MRLSVLVEKWQIECCGEPFEVGASVAWQLVFEPYDGGRGGRDDLAVDVVPIAWRRLRDGPELFDCARVGPGVEVAMRQGIARDQSPMRRTLVEDHHGGAPESLLVTQATVCRIELATQEFRLTEGALFPVPGTTRLVEVPRVPAAFRDEPVTDGSKMVEIGVLCEIETDGAS